MVSDYFPRSLLFVLRFHRKESLTFSLAYIQIFISLLKRRFVHAKFEGEKWLQSSPVHPEKGNLFCFFNYSTNKKRMQQFLATVGIKRYPSHSLSVTVLFLKSHLKVFLSERFESFKLLLLWNLVETEEG